MSKNCTLEEIAALLLAQDKLVLCPHFGLYAGAENGAGKSRQKGNGNGG